MDDDDEAKAQPGWTLVWNDSGGLYDMPELTMQYEEDDSRDLEEKERRLVQSHYGFFARSMSSQAFVEFGHASGRGFWKKMVAKERREMGRRTMLKTSKDELSVYSLHKHLPSLPTSAQDSDSMRPSSGLRPSTRERSLHRQMTPSILELSRKNCGPTEEKRLEMRDNIIDGMRVIILKAAIEDGARRKLVADAVSR